MTRLTTDHLWSIAGYIRWYGPTLLAMDRNGDPGHSVDLYLRTRPLWQGVACELLRRRALDIDLLDALRDQGPVPWELVGA